MDAPSRKRKRVSHNRKKGWKKVDIQDVEDHLESQRLQERTGGLVAKKTNEQLFFVDTSKQEKISKTKLQKRKRNVSEDLKCHALLKPDPHTTVVCKLPGPKKPENVLKAKCLAVQKKIANGTLTKTEKKACIQRRKQRRKWEKQAKLNATPLANIYDVWAESAKTTDEGVIHYNKVTRKAPVKQPVYNRQRPESIPAVQVPHPGASYNPSFDDHQQLVQAAVQVEEKKEKADMKLKRALDHYFPTRAEAPTEESYLREMSGGLFAEPEESDQSASEDEDTGLSVNPPVRREDKKTEKQRRKEEKVKQEEAQRLLEKENKIKKNKEFRLGRAKAEAHADAMALRARAKLREEKREKNKDNPRKLGPLKFEEPDLELKLSTELVGSLRQLKPEGNVLEDRFKSLQRRNVIETRKRAKFKRKYKLKKYVKRAHRDAELDKLVSQARRPPRRVKHKTRKPKVSKV